LILNQANSPYDEKNRKFKKDNETENQTQKHKDQQAILSDVDYGQHNDNVTESDKVLWFLRHSVYDSLKHFSV